MSTGRRSSVFWRDSSARQQERRLEEGAAGSYHAPRRQTPPRLPCHLHAHWDCFHTCLRAFREANFQDTVLELGGGLLPLHAGWQRHGA